jgi:ribulose-phosphate 3-epimerase
VTRTLKIAPSILSADFARLGEQVRDAEAAGADSISLDVMDGHYVPPITFGADLIKAVRKVTSLPLEAHLMVTNPEIHVVELVEAGVETIIVHVETAPHLHKVLADIRAAGGRTGITLNPATPLGSLDPVLAEVDQVQIMSVNPGWGGQKFIESSLGRIRELRASLDALGSEAVLEVDGGVNEKTIASVAEAGADLVVAGSAVFNDRESVADAMQRLRAAIPS